MKDNERMKTNDELEQKDKEQDYKQNLLAEEEYYRKKEMVDE